MLANIRRNRYHTRMEEGRKRVLGTIIAGILVALHLKRRTIFSTVSQVHAPSLSLLLRFSGPSGLCGRWIVCRLQNPKKATTGS